ncbi:MAG: Hsp70 family protein, partial [bacterium]|nr:Hsp70 family protein [bacterium]
VNSQAFGLAVLRRGAGGEGERYVEHLIHRNTPLPASVHQTFGTSRDDQRQIHIQVYEQAGAEESEEVDNNHLLIDGFIEDLPPRLPRGSDIDVTFTLTEAGLLEVVAVEASSSKQLELAKDVSDTVSDAERRKMLSAALELKVT